MAEIKFFKKKLKSRVDLKTHWDVVNTMTACLFESIDNAAKAEAIDDKKAEYLKEYFIKSLKKQGFQIPPIIATGFINK